MKQQMKVVILAGGFGTRLSEETDSRPKPMVEIGERPILWHIMKTYAHFGYKDFVICLGYKGYMIKEYFANYFLHQSDATIDMPKNRIQYHSTKAEPWKVTLVDTGLSTMTGGRLKRVQQYIGERPFHLTYGDGVSDVDIAKLVRFHREHGKLATVTAVMPAGRFGAMTLGGQGQVKSFKEKPGLESSWINGGYFVLQPEIFDRLEGDDTVWERGPLEQLAETGELRAFKHQGFWKPMDTLRDRRELEQLWRTGTAPWKLWKD